MSDVNKKSNSTPKHVAQKEARLIELLHELTQKEFKITFTHDFPGMLTIGATREGKATGNHWHVGTPYGSLKELESYTRNCLSEVEARDDSEG